MASTKTAQAVPVAQALREAIEQAPVLDSQEWDDLDRHRLGSWAGWADLVVFEGDANPRLIALPRPGDRVHRVNPDGTTGERLA
jgi:hypothetical protein